VRIEFMLFDGFRPPVDGELHPDLERPSIGFNFKHKDEEAYRVA
jgi:hypothetical protein